VSTRRPKTTSKSRKPRTTSIEPTAPLKAIERRKSKISGWGVYALEPITKNSRIVDYAGEKISWKDSDKREVKYLKKGCIWCFILNRRTVRDAAVGGNIARFINHNCKPNCYTQIIGDIIWIRAGRNIRRGEELTYNYETEGGAGIPCLCRPGCKTVL
jgi:SET domain-containing protein